MVWINIAVGAVCGAVASGIVHVFTRKLKTKRNYSVITLIIMAALFALSRQFITPHINDYYNSAHLEDSLLKNPAYSAIKQYDPTTYNNILSQLDLATKEGKSQDEAVALVHASIVALIQKRIPYASDEAVATYMKVMVQELKELQRAGNKLCYGFLFPQRREAFDMSKYISTSTSQADQKALVEVIKSSSVAPQSIPTERDVLPLLQPILIELIGKYGDIVSILENAEALGVDKAKVCDMTIVLYDRVLQLPPSQGGKVIRFMFGQNQ
ncbi:hypothetical protein HU724_004470 [Pseudomonas iranensis]|uniref:hypothetical protein n=1 Tax=Pseudomonas iranensis TaxID=2745503 RepID=UPI001644D73E|nr:hypothetical protein [Pseudomonas iranensis]QXI23534.1 hypothetical protein HU724_004470 [Pseudomonas iranensis]